MKTKMAPIPPAPPEWGSAEWILEDEHEVTTASKCCPKLKAYRAAKAAVNAAAIEGVNNLRLHGVFELSNEHCGEWNLALICGGLNGSGKWTNYLEALKDVVRALPGAYVVHIKNDALDDVWDALIGFRMR